MDNNTNTVLLLALASLLLGSLAAALFVYIIVPWHRRRQARARARAAAAYAAANPEVPEPEPEPEESSKPSQRHKQHSLFVIFKQPDEATSQRLAEWLKQHEARYDLLKKVFLVTGPQPANPITVANAFLPGELPDLFRKEYGDEPIRGISMIVKPPIHKRRNQQMHLFVAMAREANDLFDADVLDTDREPVTEATYSAILGEQ